MFASRAMPSVGGRAPTARLSAARVAPAVSVTRSFVGQPVVSPPAPHALAGCSSFWRAGR